MDMFIMCQIPLYVVFASSTNGGVIWASNKLHNWKSFSYLLLNVVIIYIYNICIYIYIHTWIFIYRFHRWVYNSHLLHLCGISSHQTYKWGKCPVRLTNFIYIWVNHNDLTATSLEIMVNKGNHPLLWPYFRLVNYYDLPRYIYIYIPRSLQWDYTGCLNGSPLDC